MFENLSLSAHLLPTTLIIRGVRRKIREIRKTMDKIKNNQHEFEEAVNEGRIAKVDSTLSDFRKWINHMEEIVGRAEQSEFIVEHRVLQHLGEIVEKLSQLERESREDSDIHNEIQADLKQLTGRVKSIADVLRQEWARTRDISLNIERWRDTNSSPDVLVDIVTRFEVRSERKAAKGEGKEEGKVLDQLQKILTTLERKKAKVSSQSIKQLTAELQKYSLRIINFFKEAFALEEFLITFDHQLRDLDAKKQAEVLRLLKFGYDKDKAARFKEGSEKGAAVLAQRGNEQILFERQLLENANIIERIAA